MILIEKYIKNFNYVFYFWLISSLLDWVITTIGIFKFSNCEDEIIPLYFITNYGLIGFIFLGMLYLYITIFLYNKLLKYINITCYLLIVMSAIHIYGAWTQLLGIVFKLFPEMLNSDIFFNIIRIMFVLIMILSYYLGTKNRQ